MGTAPDDDKRAIEDLLIRFCRVTDAGDFDSWVNLFTDDGSFIIFGQRTTGPDALRAFIEADQPPEKRGLHLVGNVLIDVKSPKAGAECDFIFIATTPEGPNIIATGRYLDTLVKTNGTWKFHEREAVLTMNVREGEFGERGGASATFRAP